MRMHRRLCYMESSCRNVSTEQTNNKYTYKHWKVTYKHSPLFQYMCIHHGRITVPARVVRDIA